MRNRFAFAGLAVAGSLSMVALLFWLVQMASAAGPRPAWPGGHMNIDSGSISVSATLYLPMIQLSRPRPYVPPDNAVSIVNINNWCYVISIRVGSCWLVGEVMNTTSTPVYDVTVRQDECDINGNVIRNDESSTRLPQIATGQLGSFGITTDFAYFPYSIPCGATRVVTWSTQISNAILPVTVLNSNWTTLTITNAPGSEIVEIRGALRNDTSQSLTSTVAAATLYDSAGNIIDTGSYTAETTLEPGITVPFTITLVNWPAFLFYSGQFRYYDVSAQGRGAP